VVRKLNRKNLFLLLSVAAFVAGCTRKSPPPVDVRIQLNSSQKVGALSVPAGYQLSHIVVNVRASDMGVRLFSWSARCGDDCVLPPPPYIEMTVPSGSSRLVQYLGVYENEAGNLLMYYGETTKSLRSGTDEVIISPAQFGVASGLEGIVAGQYVTSVVSGKGHGPTGRVDVIFRPPTGSAPLLIERAEMFDGWFAVFSLEGVPMEYVVTSTREKLMYQSAPLGFEAIKGDLSGNARPNVVHFVSPSQYWVSDGGGGGRRESHGGHHLLGFFGPEAGSLSSPKACYPPSLTLSEFWNAEVSGGNLSYCGTGPCTGQDIKRLGLGGTSIGSCNIAGNAFVSEIEYDPIKLRNGKWDAVPFRGPFMHKTFSPISPCSGMGGGTSPSNSCHNEATGDNTLEWAWLPGVLDGPNAISGAALFYKHYIKKCEYDGPCTNEFRENSSDLYKCGSALLNAGFTKGPDFGSAIESYNFNLPIAAGGNIKALLCPYREVSGVRQYFGSALDFWNLRGPMLTVNNVQIATAGDNVLDGFLVDPNVASADPTVTWSAVSGASQYRVNIMNSSWSPACEEIVVSTTSANMGTPCGFNLSETPDGEYMRVTVTALDSNGQMLAYGERPYYLVLNVPVVTSVTIDSCTQWGGGPDTQLNGSVASTGSVFSFDWMQSSGTGYTSSGGFNFTSSSTTFGLQVDMDYGFNHGTGSFKITPVHPSGYLGVEVVYPLTYDGFDCTLGP